MKRFRAAPHALLLAALALGVAACGPKKDQAPPQPKVTAAAKAAAAPVAALPVLGVAPAWKLQDVNGAAVTSEQLKGKVVVLDFWATWCPPCREEIPGYIALQKKYGQDGVALVGVSLDQAGPGVVKEFMGKFGVNYQMLMADDAVIAAFGGVEAIPTTFLIDRTGKIRDRKVGSEPTAEYEKKIQALLN